jgi:hypothetical protein
VLGSRGRCRGDGAPLVGVDSWMMKASLGRGNAHGPHCISCSLSHARAPACRPRPIQTSASSSKRVTSLSSFLCRPMTAPIERLPAEVFDIIALDIDLAAYKHLRLASHQLHLLSLTTFAKRYFTEITTTLSSPSLGRIIHVSNHRSFGNAVSLLTVRLLDNRDYKVLTKICDVGIFPPPKRFPHVPGVQTAHIRDEVISYNDIIFGDRLRHITDLLARALRSLIKLKTIRFRAVHRDPTEWERTGPSENNQIYRTRCFKAVVDAIMQSKIQLDEFSMAQRKSTTTLCKQADIHYRVLQALPLSFASLQRSFLHLHSLTLAFVATLGDPPGTSGVGSDIALFISCAPNLRNLALSFDRKRNISHDSAAIFHEIAISCRITSLESFHLLNCSLREGDLDRFVTTHAAILRSLVINNVRQSRTTWVAFWTFLKSATNLRSLRLERLYEDDVLVKLHWRKKMRITFKLDTASSGRTMYDMLDELIAAYSRPTDLPPAGHDTAGG